MSKLGKMIVAAVFSVVGATGAIARADTVANEEVQVERRGVAKLGERLLEFVETKVDFGRAAIDLWNDLLEAMLNLWSGIQPAAAEAIELVKVFIGPTS